MKIKILFIAGAFLAVVAGCHGPRQIVAPGEGQQPLDERLAKIRMTDLEGKPISLADFSGKPVFLNFWATWCGPCVSEMKSIEAVSQRFKNDIVFLAASTETPAKIQAFTQKNPFKFKFVQLNGGYLDVYVVKLPTTLLINKKGEIVAEEEGYRDWGDPSSIKKLEAMLRDAP